MLSSRILCLLVFLLPFSPAHALQCVADPLAVFTELGGNPDDKQVHVHADNSEGDYALAQFDGSVEMQQGDKHHDDWL